MMNIDIISYDRYARPHKKAKDFHIETKIPDFFKGKKLEMVGLDFDEKTKEPFIFWVGEEE